MWQTDLGKRRPQARQMHRLVEEDAPLLRVAPWVLAVDEDGSTRAVNISVYIVFSSVW